jgi:hypothetical protein
MKMPGAGFSSTLTLVSVSRSSITHSLRVVWQEMLRQVNARVNFPDTESFNDPGRLASPL